MKTSTNRIMAFFASLILSAGFAVCCFRIPALSAAVSSIGNVNLLTYAMTVILFCVSYLIFSILLARTEKPCFFDTPRNAFFTVVLLITVNILFFIRMYRLEVDVYGSVSARYVWHSIPFWLVLICLVTEGLVFLHFARNNNFSVKTWAMSLFYGLLTLLVAYNFYTPEVFLRNEPDRLHMDAYFNSIYNVLHGSPYTEYTTSIYGHYGILYKLPMKILGGDLIDFILLNTIIGALCFLAAFLTLHFIVKNDLLRVLGSIALTFPVLSMRGGIYWQLWPHRILFMCLMLFWIASCVRFKKSGRLICILGYVLSLLGILWNTETGLFCAISWAAFWILRCLCHKKDSWLPVLKTCLLHLAGILLSFLGAYAVVELYNIMNGGQITGIREFLFPLLQSSYMDGLLRVDLPEFASAYMIILVLFFMACAWGISHIWFVRTQEEADSQHLLRVCFTFAAAVLSLGQITYFINRAAYHNLEIIHIPCILLLCIFAEEGMNAFQTFHIRNMKSFSGMQIFKGTFTALSLLVLMTVSTGNIIQYGQNTALREELHNEQELNDFAAHIAANIPENTYAFGIGVPEIYSILRWDTGCYTLDLADLSLRPEAGDYIMDDIKAKKIPAFLAGEGTIRRLEKYSSKEKSQWLLDTYEISREFEFKGAVLQYFTLK